MYCSSCGTEMPEHFRFCSQCGASVQGDQPQPLAAGPLRRSRQDKKIAGVCAGLARYLNIDTVLVRIIMLCLLFSGVGLLFYIVCWVVMPLDPLLLPAPPAYPVASTPVRL
jgi:phage shock protein C